MYAAAEPARRPPPAAPKGRVTHKRSLVRSLGAWLPQAIAHSRRAPAGVFVALRLCQARRGARKATCKSQVPPPSAARTSEGTHTQSSIDRPGASVSSSSIARDQWLPTTAAAPRGRGPPGGRCPANPSSTACPPSAAPTSAPHGRNVSRRERGREARLAPHRPPDRPCDGAAEPVRDRDRLHTGPLVGRGRRPRLPRRG